MREVFSRASRSLYPVASVNQSLANCTMSGYADTIRTAFVLIAAGFCIVVIWHWPLWARLPEMLARDSLWHLSPFARVMLVALSVCAVTATALCCLVKSIYFERQFHAKRPFSAVRRLGSFVFDFLTSCVLLWGAVSLAPQLFYMLYVIVIPGLSNQWVANPIDCEAFVEFFRLTAEDSIASLFVGVLLLSILVASSILWLCVPSTPVNSKR